jgi:hypothetical protein
LKENLVLIRAPKGAEASWLRITGLESIEIINLDASGDIYLNVIALKGL